MWPVNSKVNLSELDNEYIYNKFYLMAFWTTFRSWPPIKNTHYDWGSIQFIQICVSQKCKWKDFYWILYDNNLWNIFYVPFSFPWLKERYTLSVSHLSDSVKTDFYQCLMGIFYWTLPVPIPIEKKKIS